MKNLQTMLVALFLSWIFAVPASANVSSEVVQLDLANDSVVLSEVNGISTYIQGASVIQSTGGCLIQQTGSGTEATSHTISVTGGNCVITIANLNVVSDCAPIFVQEGSLKLTLLGENTLSSSDDAGIAVPEGAILEIKGTGSLKVSGGALSAGIGGRLGNAGSITVNSGTITAIGGSWGAGIGGGKRGNGGAINVSGGTVIATGGEGVEGLVAYGGAGIGGGVYGNSGIVNISGGDITATGKGTGSYGYGGAGIGGGNKGKADSVTISNGNVTAVGGRFAAGIGGGDNSDGGTIAISGGVVTATSGSGHSNYYSITGCAGIGGGANGDGGTITISGGTITAKSTNYGAGIGGGSYADGGNITISGGNVTSEAVDGAGIGGGHEGNGGIITITDGTIYSKSNTGAGIGGGNCGSGGTICILGGNVTAIATHRDKWYTVGPSAIGGGYTGNGGSITIIDAEVTAKGDVHAIGGGSLQNTHGCDSISITNSILTLSFSDEEGSDYQEQIKNLDILPNQAASIIGSIPAITTGATSFSGISAYQWEISTPELSGYPINDMEGQTESSVSFLMLSEYDKQYVNCKITNIYGNVAYTSNVQLFELSFLQQPASVESEVGELTTFEIVPSCSNVTYQWQKSVNSGENWFDVAHGTNSILGITTSLSENGALYRCIVTATNGDKLISEIVTVTVQSNDTTYTVLHYQQTADGLGYVVIDKEVIIAAVDAPVAASAKSYEGFHANTTLGVSRGIVSGDNSLTLSQYYDRNTYSIAFKMNGGPELSVFTALYGAEIVQPIDPSRYGYTFAGWYANEELTENFIFSTMPLNGATAYAKWEPIGVDRGIEYTINGLYIRDCNTYELKDTIPENGFLVEASITNLGSTTTDTIMLVYYRENGQMIGMQYMYANPQIGQTLTFGSYVSNTNGDIGIIKAFVLPTLGNPIPLAESKELIS